jgi:hypothetical protein
MIENKKTNQKKMEFKWKFCQGCQTQVFFYTLSEIEVILEEDRKVMQDNGFDGEPYHRPQHKEPRNMEIGDYIQGNQFWASIERVT